MQNKRNNVFFVNTWSRLKKNWWYNCSFSKMSTFVLKHLVSWSNNIQSLQQRLNFYAQSKAKEETRKLCCILCGSMRVVILSHTPLVFISPCFITLIFCNLFSIHLFYYFFSMLFFLPTTFTHTNEPGPLPTTFSYTHSHAELRKDVDMKHFDFVHSVPLNIKKEQTFLLFEGFQNEQLLKFNTSSPLWFPSAVFGKN